MAGSLLEGRSIAEKLKIVIIDEITALKARCSRNPKLVALQVGENAASSVYMRIQKRIAQAVGIEYETRELHGDAAQEEVIATIEALNHDEDVSAIIMSLPVPSHIDAKKMVSIISPDKDAEGMHPENIGKILFGTNLIGPCTAMAVMELLGSLPVTLYGKEACIVGHSDIIGKPLAMMLLNKLVTTTVCHVATAERGFLQDHVKRAELLIVAVGKPGIIKGEWIREKAIVIDVGINHLGDKIVGDVEYEPALSRASYITPVPGGVGPITTMILMRNTLELFKKRLQNIEVCSKNGKI